MSEGAFVLLALMIAAFTRSFCRAARRRDLLPGQPGSRPEASVLVLKGGDGGHPLRAMIGPETAGQAAGFS